MSFPFGEQKVDEYELFLQPTIHSTENFSPEKVVLPNLKNQNCVEKLPTIQKLEFPIYSLYPVQNRTSMISLSGHNINCFQDQNQSVMAPRFPRTNINTQFDNNLSPTYYYSQNLPDPNPPQAQNNQKCSPEQAYILLHKFVPFMKNMEEKSTRILLKLQTINNKIQTPFYQLDENTRLSILDDLKYICSCYKAYKVNVQPSDPQPVQEIHQLETQPIQPQFINPIIPQGQPAQQFVALKNPLAYLQCPSLPQPTRMEKSIQIQHMEINETQHLIPPKQSVETETKNLIKTAESMETENTENLTKTAESMETENTENLTKTAESIDTDNKKKTTTKKPENLKKNTDKFKKRISTPGIDTENIVRESRRSQSNTFQIYQSAIRDYIEEIQNLRAEIVFLEEKVEKLSEGWTERHCKNCKTKYFVENERHGKKYRIRKCPYKICPCEKSKK